MLTEFIGQDVHIETANTQTPIRGVLQRYDEQLAAFVITNECETCDHEFLVFQRHVVAIARIFPKADAPKNTNCEVLS